MRLMSSLSAVFAAVLLLQVPLLAAKEAVPMAKDPVLEKIVNEIADELRCLVCQNQTIADSDADLAVDLKSQVRDMVREGKTQDEIIDYMVQRYGDFIRYRPPMKASTYLLWVGPFLLLFVGLTVLILNLRKRRLLTGEQDAALSPEESDRLTQLLKTEKEKNKS
ncbi:MAG: cytochrome c-type biogenesis protein CcmH [Gammaproteobacteria bacterium]|nr:cytochrome c-type biogenesis protein CcmH [Gammaproteobacteria bacterium]MCF6362560.1 cytochrome c-type biogenesis protein CcmH [Gammaproteobacteria bacterium]